MLSKALTKKVTTKNWSHIVSRMRKMPQPQHFGTSGLAKSRVKMIRIVIIGKSLIYNHTFFFPFRTKGCRLVGNSAVPPLPWTAKDLSLDLSLTCVSLLSYNMCESFLPACVGVCSLPACVGVFSSLIQVLWCYGPVKIDKFKTL